MSGTPYDGGMKSHCLILAAMILLPAAARTQALPDNPAPAPPPDPMWSQVKQLVIGQEIQVKPTIGYPVHCRFTGATDAYLFCDPDRPLPGARGYQFGRAQVVSVKISHPRANWHPVLLGSAAAVGIAVGASYARSMDASQAATVGFTSALVWGAIGYPIAMVLERDREYGLAFQLPVSRFAGPEAHRIFRR